MSDHRCFDCGVWMPPPDPIDAASIPYCSVCLKKRFPRFEPPTMKRVLESARLEIERIEREGIITTAETPTMDRHTYVPTMKERLARNAARRYFDDFDWSLMEYSDREAYADAYWPKFVDGVDEDLREMMEPSEGMIEAAKRAVASGTVDIYTAMIQHILNEPKD